MMTVQGQRQRAAAALHKKKEDESNFPSRKKWAMPGARSPGIELAAREGCDSAKTLRSAEAAAVGDRRHRRRRARSRRRRRTEVRSQVEEKEDESGFP